MSIHECNQWYFTPVFLDLGVSIGIGDSESIKYPLLSSHDVEITDRNSLSNTKASPNYLINQRKDRNYLM